MAISSRTFFLGAAGSYLLLLVLGTRHWTSEKFCGCSNTKEYPWIKFVILFKVNPSIQKTPTHPTPILFEQGRFKKKKMSGVRLIPDSSNPLSLCWLLFARSILSLSLSCSIQTRLTSPHCIIRASLLSRFLLSLATARYLQDYCKEDISAPKKKGHSYLADFTNDDPIH